MRVLINCNPQPRAAAFLAFGFASVSFMTYLLHIGFGGSLATQNAEVYVLLLGRKPEKESSTDTVAFRTSPISLYRWDGVTWNKLTEDLLTRSTSTNITRPSVAEGDDFAGNAFYEKKHFEYGFVSVPLGVYSLKQVNWKQSGDIAFELSDFGRIDGQIALPNPQVIRHVDISSNGTGGISIEDLKEVSSSWTKEKVFIHPSITKYWSRGDSKGCINLFHPVPGFAGDKESDWNKLVKNIETRKIKIENVFLVILPYEEVTSSKENLADKLESGFYKKYFDRNLEPLS